MNRRRLFYLCTTLVLIGGGVAAWIVFARRDADIVTVGPMTNFKQHHFAMLDSTVDAADFHDCKNLRQVILRLSTRNYTFKHKSGAIDCTRYMNVWVNEKTLIQKDRATKISDLPTKFAAQSTPMTVKQLLRLTFAKCGTQEINFIVRDFCIEVTSAKCAQAEREEYLASIGTGHRLLNLWKEMTGDLAEPEPPEEDFP